MADSCACVLMRVPLAVGGSVGATRPRYRRSGYEPNDVARDRRMSHVALRHPPLVVALSAQDSGTCGHLKATNPSTGVTDSASATANESGFAKGGPRSARPSPASPRPSPNTRPRHPETRQFRPFHRSRRRKSTVAAAACRRRAGPRRKRVAGQSTSWTEATTLRPGGSRTSSRPRSVQRSGRRVKEAL
jgi:hypothetical protein